MNKKHVLRTIIILACIAAAAVFVCYRLYKKNSTKIIDVYPVSNMAVPDYEETSGYYASVSKGRVQNVTLKDSLISEIKVSAGDTVEEGDVLMVYDQTSLSLAIDSDRTHIALLENRIDKANRRIAHYNGLIPSEYMPEGSEETVDHGPLKLKKVLKASDCKDSGEPIKCSIDTVIRTDFLKTLRDKKYIAVLELYDEDTCFGTYTIDGSEIPKKTEEYVLYVPEAVPSLPPADGAAELLSSRKYVLLDEGTDEPATEPTSEPTAEPTDTPEPTDEPTVTPEPTDEPTVTPEPTDEPTVTSEPTDEPTDTPAPTDEPTDTPAPTDEPTDTPAPTDEPTVTPEPTDEPTVTPEPTVDPTVTPEPTGKPTVTPAPTPVPGMDLYIKVKTDPITEDWILSDIITFNGDGADINPDTSKHYYGTFSSCTPYMYERYETIYNFPDFDENSENYMYSAAEIASMIKETQAEIEALKIDLESARITLQQDTLISENGEVKASISGTVTEVKDPAETSAGETIITVRGTENYTITVYVNEMDLDKVNANDILTGMSYESGTAFTAVVTEKGDTPATGFYGWYEANPNTSIYPVTAVIEESDIEMNIGETCEVRPMDDDPEISSTFFIPNSFIRSDERGSYIYKDSSGLLKKEYILTGRSMWNSYTEIKGGLTQDENIAFPYGTGVTDNATTKVSEEMIY